ncbi:glycoside hydrolase family 99-like domain-containing protein [Pseudomonas sp. MIS38]|uniref:glycoside hydrolase family 99-like domain-containing protein n=1 Tax=Pseudomonas sp. MIS38 TaxID=91465 RepID=UPI001CA668E5|nr:glycoside hydrolase family 99-like domain-containing protein [Pseudomonas sp. MIS38]MBY8957981.1 glycoside hydrolase family 99-like domain-containing protein [Pseudomonas sp. MIS38]
MTDKQLSSKRIIVVLGMHRCGTSVITRALSTLGVDLGDHLMPPSDGNNDKGFWEDIDFNQLNIELLQALGHDWHSLTPVNPNEWLHPELDKFKARAKEIVRSKFQNTDCFGVKDPRMARTMPFWIEIFEDLALDTAYIIAYRNPGSAARSLAARDGFELEKGYFLWQEHMLLSLKYSENSLRVIVDYDLILKKPNDQIKRIADALNLNFDTDNAALNEFNEHFLEKSLRHHSVELEELKVDDAAPASITRLSKLISSMASDQIADDAEAKNHVDALFIDIFDDFPAYKLMRILDQRATELLTAGWEKDLQIEQQKKDYSDAHKTISNLEFQVENLKNSSAEQKSKITELEEQVAAELKHKKVLSELLDNHAIQINELLKTTSRYSSGRFLLKALARLVAKRILAFKTVNEKKIKSKILAMGLLDEQFYLNTYKDVKNAKLNALDHYLDHGWQEGRAPSEHFSTTYYLEAYEDVQRTGINPLVHYVRHGHKEGRSIFDVTGHRYQFKQAKSASNKYITLVKLLINDPVLIRRFLAEAKRSGVHQAIALAKSRVQRELRHPQAAVQALNSASMLEYGLYKVVPFNLNPYLHDMPSMAAKKIAVHLHFFYEDMGERCVEYLNNIPLEFDLFVSVQPKADIERITKFFSEHLTHSGQIFVEHSQNRGRDIAPLICLFGRKLSEYDYIGHFHTKKSPHREDLNEWFDALMMTLCGESKQVAQIFKLLEDDAKVVYAAGNQVVPGDDGWSDNKEIAKEVLERYTDFDIANFPSVEFPQGTMFWATTESIRDYLLLPLKYEDFPAEPILPDATLAHALERLLLIFSTKTPGRNYRIEARSLSSVPLAYYEEQKDYASSIAHDTIKVLAYYLPQFSPNPENDEWHGKGFTEWHKVRAANPLFHGHYQQHVPHPDIGYYSLETHHHMAIQAAQMEKAGVHGMIFYHYWFSGKLILEKPAQMLLEHPEINMPFSFCWANENWTRRWDGNEQEILLGQVYSKEDALGFIRYLIPFFKDHRYIKVDGRPLLFVYRPSSMEFVQEYIDIWAAECEDNGIKAPYVVATLTRGATAPQDYGMDAAVERVLQDWTGGAVPDINNQKQPYWPINGSILDYSAVADHYIEKELSNDYTLFRSLVPTWDNTARYGTEAYALDGFTTSKFQNWLEHLIDYSEQNLPEDRRFVVINAWNEWAEGAHLEPDTRFGYGYLNSVGRALSGYKFDDIEYLPMDKTTVVNISVSEYTQKRLSENRELRSAFYQCIKNSSVFSSCTVTVSDEHLLDYLEENGVIVEKTSHVDSGLNLEFNNVYLFPSFTIENLLKMSTRHVGYNICASIRNQESFASSAKQNNGEVSFSQRSGIILKSGLRNAGYKECGNAPCFTLLASDQLISDAPARVSTIIRFHKQGSRKLLKNCLLSLIAQHNCQVHPILAIQDMTPEEVETLKQEISQLPWPVRAFPEFQCYYSTAEAPDLRSLMLNEALKSVKNGYVTFLDYDDVVFPDAYSKMAARLAATGKNATFGRVYSTLVHSDSGLITARDRTYTYGHTFEDFLNVNHAPIHSFMLDISKCNTEAIEYFADMKYMEDYYMTLQLFTKNETDWKSLETDFFVGDYIHRIDSEDSNTLAINDKDQRASLLSSEPYLLSEKRIKELRTRVSQAI